MPGVVSATGNDSKVVAFEPALPTGGVRIWQVFAI